MAFERSWCGREESNLHGLSPQRPQRCASTYSATTAWDVPRVRPGYGSKRAPRQGRVGGRAALANLACGCKARLKGLGLGCQRVSRLPLANPAVLSLEPQTSASAEVEWLTSREPVPYEAAVEAMDARVAAILEARAPEAVWLLEHPALYTAGTSAAPEELIEPSRFPVFRTGRGGRFTYHGPGQRVAYVMLDLGRPRPRRARFRARAGRLAHRHARAARCRRRAPRGADRRLCRRGQDREHRHSCAPLGELPRREPQRRSGPRRISPASSLAG